MDNLLIREMGDIQLLFLSVATTALGLILIGFAPARVKSSLTAILIIINSIFTSILSVGVLLGHPVEFIISGAYFYGDIPIRIDSLSAWFMLIINLTSINGVLYGIGYMKSYSEQRTNLTLHWLLFLLFHSSMLWVCILQHGLAFLVTWELMSLSSLLLVIFEHQNKNTLQAGLNYLVQMHISVIFLTSAFIWVYFSTGSFDFKAIGSFFIDNPNIWLFLLFFIGFGIKAGFVPLHSWLPHAHPAAPSHVSGIMSGVIVKLGIYGILRIATFLKQDYILIGESILAISVVTGLYGILNAAVHRDFKKMLAYCTVENIGIIGTGIGLGIIGIGMGNTILIVLGFAGAMLHTLNHSLFKSLLFFSAGSVYQQTHTRDMEKLGGLMKQMPQTGFLFLIGALAIGGLPPFNGFVSEFILYSGYLEGIKTLDITNSTLLIFTLSSLAIIGGLSILTFSKSFGTIFFGSARTKLHHKPVEVSFIMLLPQYFIMGIMLSIGVFPGFYFKVVFRTISTFLPAAKLADINVINSIVDTVSVIGMYSFIFMGMIAAVYYLRVYFTRRQPAEYKPTWGCAYIAPNPRMQYTGKSFSKTLGKLLDFILIENKRYKEIHVKETFPAQRKHSSHYLDFFETRIFNDVIDRLVYSLNYFQFIQNGKTQAYVLYGIFFIVLIFMGTLFKLI
ncbi:MAG: proton-conducting transporter membrane subunit [Bacteroidales bacterium]